MSWVIELDDGQNRAWSKRAKAFVPVSGSCTIDFCHANLKSARQQASQIARRLHLLPAGPWDNPAPALGRVRVVHQAEFAARLGLSGSEPFPSSHNDPDWHPRYSPFAVSQRLASALGIAQPLIREAVKEEPTKILGKTHLQIVEESRLRFVWIGDQTGRRACVLSLSARPCADRYDGTEWHFATPLSATDAVSPWLGETFRCGEHGAWFVPNFSDAAPTLLLDPPGDREDWQIMPTHEAALERLGLLEQDLFLLGDHQLPEETWLKAKEMGEARTLLANTADYQTVAPTRGAI